MLQYLLLPSHLDIGFPVGWVGVALMVGGLALRWWASAVLGGFYTSTLRLAKGQQIINEGPYRLVRHPGYAGVLVPWVGAGLASQNWWMAVIVLSLMSVAYATASALRGGYFDLLRFCKSNFAASSNRSSKTGRKSPLAKFGTV
jgi:protein-S-isoprenylcysteine O-methyltransferase Ste14